MSSEAMYGAGILAILFVAMFVIASKQARILMGAAVLIGLLLALMPDGV